MSPAPVFVRIPGSHHPGTRLHLVPGFRDPGSVLILGQVTQYGNPYLICITESRTMKLVDYRHAILPKTCPKTLSADQYNTWDPCIVNYVSGRMESAWNRVIYPAGCNCFMRGYFHDTIPFNNNADHAILLWQNLGNMHFGRFYRTICTGYDMLTVFIRPLENGRIMPW